MTATPTGHPDRHPDLVHVRIGRGRLMAVVLLAALVVTALLVLRTSRAAFVASTENAGNSFVAGDVVLSDDARGVAAMFTEATFVPGDTVVECIAVTYEGSIPEPGPVRLYSGGVTDVRGPDPASRGLSRYLRVTVEEGTGASFGRCGGFVPSATIVDDVTLSALAATRTDHASGAGAWAPTSTPDVRSYRVSVTLDETGTPNEEQGAGATDIAFVWEVVS